MYNYRQYVITVLLPGNSTDNVAAVLFNSLLIFLSGLIPMIGGLFW